MLTYGEAGDADVRIDRHRARRARPGRRSPLRTPWGTVAVRLGVSGRHMVANAAAALAVAGAVGADLDAAAGGAGRPPALSPMRMQLVRTRVGRR